MRYGMFDSLAHPLIIHHSVVHAPLILLSGGFIFFFLYALEESGKCAYLFYVTE